MPARPVQRRARRLIDLDRRGGSFDIPRPQAADLDQSLGQRLGLAGHEHRAWRCQLLHARGHVNHRPDNIDLEPQLGRDRAIENVARVESDAHHLAHVDVAQIALHTERREARPHGMVLVCNGCPEDRQNAIAEPTADDALIAMHETNHDLDGRLEAAKSGLRVEAFDRRRRSLEVSEKDRHPLALTVADTAPYRRSPRCVHP